jgi:hypothetical protein
MTRRLHLAGLIATALAMPAHAEPGATAATGGRVGPAATGAIHADDADDADDTADIDDDGPHVVSAAVWAGLELAIPAWYYWHTQHEQEVDWTHPSWKDKLTLRSVRFDTNPFHVNAIRHPLAGVGDYQIARSNGFGVLGATAFAYLTGAIWEFTVEYNEDPSLNDLIMNGAGGLAIGEPLYQIGQLWRGGELSIADRLRTAAFSPFAATQDVWRGHRTWLRRRAWSDFAFSAGPVTHRLDDGGTRHEVAIGVDIDVVRHRGFVTPGAHDGRIAPGAWSRVALSGRLGDLGESPQLIATTFRSRTSLAGVYRQDEAGDGALLALGTGFSYRRDRLANELDHVAIAQLVGPQLQLSRRDGETELRWDVAAYADFGLIDAHVFGPVSPLPPPPPYLSTLQVEGYYDGAGGSLETRVRADRGLWHAELELTGHRLWSLDFADRVQQTAGASRTAAVAPATATTAIPAAPHGVSDVRAYGHAQLGVRAGVWGVAATLDAAYRRGTWRDLERSTSDWTLGVLATANL